jgi:hypothetical protein
MSIFQADLTLHRAILVKSLKGRRNDFHLGQKNACEGIQPSRRAFSPDMFVIPTPRQRD